MFPRIDHMLGHKTSINKLKKVYIQQFSNYNGMKKESITGRNWEKHRHMGIKQYTNKNNKGLMNKSKRISKITFRQMKIKTQLSKTYVMQQKQI